MAPPMQPIFEKLATIGLETELLYSFVIIICSLMIYFGTKELYELTSYKGIKYFRLAFLFFAISYFFRSFIKFILIFFNVETLLDIVQSLFIPMGHLTLFLFMYFSSMAVFYLLYSVMWKKWNKNNKMIFVFHAAALIISLITIFSRNDMILFWVNLFLFVLVSIVFYIVHKESKKKGNKLYAVYMLLFVFWTLNIMDILIPSFFQGFQLILYLLSLGTFLIILYKVLKKSGN